MKLVATEENAENLGPTYVTSEILLGTEFGRNTRVILTFRRRSIKNWVVATLGMRSELLLFNSGSFRTGSLAFAVKHPLSLR